MRNIIFNERIEVLVMHNTKVSIIVPVYNTAQYLHKCLDGLVNQTYQNIEIVCVNDGSTDDSLNILREYESKDGRIVIIDRENGGLSSARNVGNDVATGDYIMFCGIANSLPQSPKSLR